MLRGLTIFTHIQNSLASGELSPSIFGRTDLQKWHSGAATYRNCFVNYRGGAASRAGLAYIGMCKQGAPNLGGATLNNAGVTIVNSGPPKDITFQFNINQGYALEFGDYYLRIKSDGAYITETPKDVVSITQANPGVVDITAHGFSNGDWVYGASIGGMTEFNGLAWIVQNVTADTFTLTDLFGDSVNTNPFPVYTSGGTFARIYTVTSPYAAIDLPYLKFTQSADTMSLTCVNQDTDTEYAPYDLQRNGAANWTFTAVTFSTSIATPTNLTATATSSTAVDTWYSYVVTSVAKDGEESVASSAVAIENNNISINAGSNHLSWNAVTNATSYKIYAATSSYNTPVPVGVLYGFAGESTGTNFVDTNIVADFSRVPPTHQNPFARGQILNVNPTALGSGYTQAGVTYTINTSTGSGATIEPVVNSSGEVSGYIVADSGHDYANTDTITITADGVGATADLNIGPQTGTYPGVVAYFQQRRVYANTLNNPDTYYMSQPGAFLNMDSSIPSSDSDAIVGQPWSQQINGIQALVPMPGGLVILTGNGSWQLTGSGGQATTVTPSNQFATPQAYNGCHSHITPIVINYDILYVQAKGSIVRDLSYNFFVNIYTGTDTTVLSNHLFTNHQIQQWAYAEEPYKLVWAIRDDGVMLSLTYLKEQDVYGWARSDTNGLFVSVCSVTEPPVDAIYTIVQRYVRANWVYYSERMNNRQWVNVEQCWCVDAGLTLSMTFPDATLTPAAANGTNNISAVTLANGGSGYTAPIIDAVDETGVGMGATFTAVLSGGVITSITPVLDGQLYTSGLTTIRIRDATGSGAIAYPVITNIVTFNTSTSVFTPNMVGDILRVGGGIAVITTYLSATQVLANIIQPITNTVPNDPNNMPIPATQTTLIGLSLPSTEWSISAPTSTITGLNHLEGLLVTGLADGGVIKPTVVEGGQISLSAPASAITIGLAFLPQLQSMYSDTPAPSTVQGKRKDIFGVTVRMEASRGMQIGTNQPDSSTQPNGATVPWTGLFDFKERNASIVAGQPAQLFTGDEYLVNPSGWDEKGQVAIQQPYPLPMNVNAIVTWLVEGDTDG